jgi:4-hydroxy-tetrahydrodipicolinate synthase
MERLSDGLYVVLVTPFTESGEINENGLTSNIDWYLELGAQGIICTGSTGSFDALSEDEMKQVISITANQVSGRATVLAGTAATTTQKCIALSKFAESVGVKGVMIVPPYYCTPCEVELYEHYKAVGESIKIPIMVYNNPRRTGVDMSPEFLTKLAGEIDNVGYIKESSGDLKRIQQTVSLAGDNLSVFIGNDDISLPALLMGAKGWVAAASNIVPEMALELVKAARQENLDKAKEIFYRLLPLFEFIKRTGKYVPVCKAGLQMRGHVGGTLRKPRLPLPKDEERELGKLLEGLGLL